jgi:hypothetical protein
MSIDELERTLPNGLHDAFVSGINLDYVERRAELKIDVWVGDLHAAPGQERERRRSGVLEISGLLYFAIEPPDPTYPFARPEPLWVDVGSSTEWPSPSTLPRELPEGAFTFLLFVQQWNSSIRVAASSVTLRWNDGPIGTDVRAR